MSYGEHMLKTLAKLVPLAALGWVCSAHALGLGEIEIKSRLNQPLSAVIPISAATPREMESLSIELASNEDFERSGMERAEFLSSLKFEIKDSIIRVTSKELAREPFVSFLLDVRWNGGRLLREYTVLLDPPTLAQPQKPAVKPTVSQVEAPVWVEEPQATDPPSVPVTEQPAASAMSTPKPPASRPAAVYDGESYGPIQPRETLWSVAYKLRPDSALTMDQMQVAIFNANPKAFEGGRLTGLMKGSMIRVPGLDEIRAVDPVAAKAQVAQANRAGRAAVSAPPAESVQPAPAPVETPAEPPPAEPATRTLPTEPSAAAPATVEQIAPSADQAAGETSPAPGIDPSPSVTPTATDPAQMVDEPAPAQAAPVEAVQTEPLPTSTAAPAELSEEPSLLDQALGLIEHPLFLPLVAGLVAVLIVLVLASKLRDKFAQWSYERASRKKIVPTAKLPSASYAEAPLAEAEQADADAVTVVREDAAPARQPEPMSATQSLAAKTQQQTMQQTLQQTQAQTQVHEATAAQTGAPKVDFDVSGTYATETVQINLDAGDPVSEAEFHRAYGLYDEAALLLKQALQKDPKRTDVRVKLAEIYFEANKTDEFVETAKQLKGQLPDAEWQKIALLGSQIAAGNDLFQGATAGGAVDLSFDEPAAPSAKPAPASVAADNGMLDFTLGDVKMPDLAAPAAAAPSAPAADALEFDLGSLSLGEPAAPAASAAPAGSAKSGGGDDFKMDDLGLGDFDLKLDAPAASSASAAPESPDVGGELSLDEAPPAGDESSTKLDLARAYMDMGDNDMAKSLLNEVRKQGSEQQKKEAQELLSRVSA